MTIPRLPLLLPGALSARTERPSKLMLSWRASDGTLDALTGQRGTLTLPTGAAGRPLITTLTGQALAAGDGQPRFGTYSGLGNKTFLAVSGEGSFHPEEFSLEFPAMIEAVTFFGRFHPLWVPGASRPTTYTLAAFGSAATVGGTDAGWLAIQREAGTTWRVTRARGATTRTSSLTENGTYLAAWDLLATMASDGAVQIALRDRTGLTTTGALSTAEATLAGAEYWTGKRLYLGRHPALAVLWEAVKVARGVKTFAEMDALA